MAASGAIVSLSIGQCCGFIRTSEGRKIWFHRSDMRERVVFNHLAIGDLVTFDLLEDRISGPRALQVRRDQSRR